MVEVWQQVYDPIGNAYLTAPLAATPIAFFPLSLTLLRPHLSLDRQTPDQAYFTRLLQSVAA